MSPPTNKPTLDLILLELVEIRKELKIVTRIDSELQGLKDRVDIGNSSQMVWNDRTTERLANIEKKLPMMELFTAMWSKALMLIFGVILVAALITIAPQIITAIKIVGK